MFFILPENPMPALSLAEQNLALVNNGALVIAGVVATAVLARLALARS